MNHRIWKFYFYVSKNWPEEEVILHFPGCTLTPNNHIYESFGFFCPIESLENVELMKQEDVLFDWSRPLYLNYTHESIVDRIEDFLSSIGRVDRIQGEVYVCKEENDKFDLGELCADEVEMRLLREEDVKGIHELYPASEIESIEVFEKLAGSLPGAIVRA